MSWGVSGSEGYTQIAEQRRRRTGKSDRTKVMR